MATYKTPGVYVEEISTLPASVAQVETAIPAFIGYTQKAVKKGESLINKPTRIKSMLDFEELYGKAPQPKSIEVTLEANNDVKKVDIEPRFYLHNSMKMFYDNGGGPCYIISVGTYKDENGDYNSIEKDKLVSGVDLLKKEDEPTLILTPDAPLLPTAQDMADVQAASLEQCNDLQDRFSIFDIYDGYKERSYDKDTDVIIQFRNKVGSKFLKYGACYYPWIKTSLGFDFKYEDVTLIKGGGPIDLAMVSEDDTEVVKLENVLSDLNTKIRSFTRKDPTFTSDYESTSSTTKNGIRDRIDTIKNVALAIKNFASGNAQEKVENKDLQDVLNDIVKEDSKLHSIVRKLSSYDRGYEDTKDSNNNDNAAFGVVGEDDFGYNLEATKENIYGNENGVSKHIKSSNPILRGLFEQTLSLLQSIESEAKKIAETQEDTVIDTNPVYSNVVNKIKEKAVILPPSAAVAGIYATVDRNRGVWKSPANISLSSTIGPTINIDKKDQEDLNVDVIAGKSVNAIRSFTGKGTLVWGARTLAGNDNEWRYISVRRFYNMVEESLKKATERVVFESNDANTWVRVKAQIENFLTVLWRDGALAGAVPEHAFFVNIGLGKTMTALDILEGRMIIEVGMAVVRPAEFIILKFSHKMQES